MSHSESLGERVAQCLSDSRDVLGGDAVKEAAHFLNHGEYEMAFEGLVLELIAVGLAPSSFDANAWVSLGRELGLEQESVLDGEFWQKFQTWKDRVAPT